ncbi:AMP-binding protein [Kitasatospora sp. NPDC056138]|uniref:AMP-binding protein n=1 Tax=Kitasatospora sp. NPDC056138 TaxID=3345724 RepID=UPI0035DA0E06
MTDTATPELTRPDLPGSELAGPDPGTLGEALVRASRVGNPEGLTFIRPDGTELRQTYLQLLMEASRVLAGLRAAGVRPGERIVLQVARAPELLAAYWACVLGGCVAVPVDASGGGAGGDMAGAGGPGGATAGRRTAAERLHRVWSAHGAPRVITGGCQEIAPETAADPRWHHAWLGDTRRLLANVPDQDWHRPDPADPAVLLSAPGCADGSGTVLLNHREVLERAAATARARGLGRSSRTFNRQPLHRIGGLVDFHTRDVLLGCHQIHADPAWVRSDVTDVTDVADIAGTAAGSDGGRGECATGPSPQPGSPRCTVNEASGAGGSKSGRVLGLPEPPGRPQDVLRPRRVRTLAG